MRPALLVTGNARSRQELLDLADGTAALQGPAESIPLRVAQRVEVSDKQAVALLVPAQPLTPGETYQLMGLPPPAPRASWPANELKDETAPRWEDTPALKGVRIQRLSTGAQIEATLSLPVNEDLLAARMEVRTLDGRLVLTDIRPVKQRQVPLFTGGCEGRLQLQAGESYNVTLWPIDLAGNRGEPRLLKINLGKS